MQAIRRIVSGSRGTALASLASSLRSQPLYRPFIRRSLPSRPYSRVAYPEIEKEGKTFLQHSWTLTKWLVLLPAALSAALLFLLKATYQPKFSAIYLGESKAFEARMSQELGIDVELVLPKMSEGLLTMMLGKVLVEVGKEDVVDKKARGAFQAIIDAYPNHFLGYTLLAWLERSQCNLSESKRLLTQALHVAETYAQENEGLAQLLPDPETFFKLQQTEEEVKAMARVEVVADNVWAVGASYAIATDGPVKDPIFIQATVVRLSDGSVVLVNPTHFSEETVAWIDSLGRVTDLVTTTKAHGSALAESKERVWPSARVYGTTESTKHDQPQLQFDGFLKPGGVLCDGVMTEPEKHFNGELEFHCLEGHIFEEAVIYHRESGTLTGLTDMLLSPRAFDAVDGPVPWGFQAYAYGLGLDRGSHTGDLVPQSYHLAFCLNRRSLVESVAEIHEKFRIEHLVLGHGGVLHGRNYCHYALSKGFKWVGDVFDQATNKFSHPLDAVALPMTWLSNNHFFLFLFKVLGATASVQRKRQYEAEIEEATKQ